MLGRCNLLVSARRAARADATRSVLVQGSFIFCYLRGAQLRLARRAALP
ncbi:hypothetical protein A2U01_0090938, partial [Trifolium medium]|nr:hypothetical protein [Trifolium medium]